MFGGAVVWTTRRLGQREYGNYKVRTCRHKHWPDVQWQERIVAGRVCECKWVWLERQRNYCCGRAYGCLHIKCKLRRVSGAAPAICRCTFTFARRVSPHHHCEHTHMYYESCVCMSVRCLCANCAAPKLVIKWQLCGWPDGAERFRFSGFGFRVRTAIELKAVSRSHFTNTTTARRERGERKHDKRN